MKLYFYMLQFEILFYLCSVPEIISHLDYSSNFQFFSLYFLHEFLNRTKKMFTSIRTQKYRLLVFKTEILMCARGKLRRVVEDSKK